jgi:hypothetical protein
MVKDCARAEVAAIAAVKRTLKIIVLDGVFVCIYSVMRLK